MAPEELPERRGGEIDDIPSERSMLNQVKNKILERVKDNQSVRQQSRDRRDSISSVGSTASKRGCSDLDGGDLSRIKGDDRSSAPIPNKE